MGRAVQAVLHQYRRAHERDKTCAGRHCDALRHPILVAQQRATLGPLSSGRVDLADGRGYDRREYAPLHIDFINNLGVFEIGLEMIQKLCPPTAASHTTQTLPIRRRTNYAQTAPKPVPVYIASFSKPSIELAARGCGLVVVVAAISYGGLKQVANLYNEARAKHCRKPGPDVQLLHPLLLRRTPTAPARSGTIRSA